MEIQEFMLRMVDSVARIETKQTAMNKKIDSIPKCEKDTIKASVSTNRRLIFLVLGLIVTIGVKGFLT